jgi:soluble lytic murein transglycosylase-like protein
MHAPALRIVYLFVGQWGAMAPKLATALLLAANAFAGEYAILASGFSMRIDRHQTNGSNVRVYMNGGFMDLPATAVVRFEQEYTAPAEPAPAAKPGLDAPTAKQLVADAARRWNLPVGFLRSIVKAESGYRSDAVSPKGAIGLMQLMPETARLLGADPNDPKQNVEAGARYLSGLLRKYQNDDYQVRKAVAAYNAGPAAVDRYQGVPPYQETIDYVERVIRQWRFAPQITGSEPR